MRHRPHKSEKSTASSLGEALTGALLLFPFLCFLLEKSFFPFFVFPLFVFCYFYVFFLFLLFLLFCFFRVTLLICLCFSFFCVFCCSLVVPLVFHYFYFCFSLCVFVCLCFHKLCLPLAQRSHRSRVGVCTVRSAKREVGVSPNNGPTRASRQTRPTRQGLPDQNHLAHMPLGIMIWRPLGRLPACPQHARTPHLPQTHVHLAFRTGQQTHSALPCMETLDENAT